MFIINFITFVISGKFRKGCVATIGSTVRTRERDVEQYLVAALARLDIPCLKFDPSGKIGMPDRIIPIPDGKVIWVEMKKPSGGKLSEVQKLRHKELRKLGQDVRVVWSKEEADQLVDEIKKGQMQ